MTTLGFTGALSARLHANAKSGRDAHTPTWRRNLSIEFQYAFGFCACHRFVRARMPGRMSFEVPNGRTAMREQVTKQIE